MAITTTPVLVLVAAASAPQAVKDVAEYVCDGTADQTEINSALAAVASTGGHVIQTPGAYSINGTITVPVSQNITWSGPGAVITAANGLNADMVTFATSGGTGVGRAEIKRIRFDGNSPNQTAGDIIDAAGAIYCDFVGCYFYRPYDFALRLGPRADASFGHNNVVDRCVFDQGDDSGGNGGGVLCTSNDENVVSKSRFQFMGGAGATPHAIRDLSGINDFSRNTFVRGKTAIWAEIADASRCHGNMFDGVDQTNLHISGSDWTVTGNAFTSGGSTANTYSHLRLDVGGGHSIVGNLFKSPSTASQLKAFIEELSSAVAGCTVQGNRFRIVGALGTAKVIRNSGVNQYRDNSGYLTESSGTTAFGAAVTSVTGIAHGLDVTPAAKDFNLQYVADPLAGGHIWVSAITSSTFTLNLKGTGPGGAGTTVGWQLLAGR